MTSLPPADDHAFAAWVAERAGRLLLDVRSGDLEGSALKDAGDLAAHEFLMTALAEHRPADAVLSEEEHRGTVSRLDRHTTDRVWIIDPLDGTREFSERPRTDWAVHVALWERGELVAGAVALPGAGITYSTGAPIPTAALAARPRLAVSRTRMPAPVIAVAEALDFELVPMGSAGAKVMAVVSGDADAYVHTGGQYEWDSAAPVAVARAAGLFTSRVDGSPLRYNQDDVRLPDLIVCHPELAEPILGALKRAGA